MKMKVARTLGALLGLLILSCVVARESRASAVFLPSVLTYQGRLKENFAPVNGTRQVEIFVCDSITAGACYSDSGPQAVTVTNGLFRSTFTVPNSVTLGFGGPYYNEVRIGGVALAPREILTATPYAVDATSGNYANISANAYGLTATPNVFAATISTNLVVYGSFVSIGSGSNSPYALSFGSNGDKVVGLEDSSGASGSTITLRAGGAGAPNASGGAVVLAPGAPGATGAPGYVEIAGGGGTGAAHLRATQSPGMTAAPNGNCGGSATGAMTPGATDMAGSVTLMSGPGGGASSACVLQVNYLRSFARAPKSVVLTPTNLAAAQSGYYVSLSSPSFFGVGIAIAPSPSVVFTWNYLIVE